MAWIKAMKDLHEDAVIMAQAAKLNMDERLLAYIWIDMWHWAGEQTADGFIAAITPDMIDRRTRVPGFAASAGKWLTFTDTGVTFYKWDTHNSESAKKRVLAAERQSRSRHADVTDMSRSERDKSVTREEKRREEKKQIHESPAFDKFWDAWPKTHRKTNRIGCLRHWVSNGLDELAETIVADVNKQKASNADWLKDGGQYIPLPMTYLNQRRWENGSGGQTHGKRAMGVD